VEAIPNWLAAAVGGWVENQNVRKKKGANLHEKMTRDRGPISQLS